MWHVDILTAHPSHRLFLPLSAPNMPIHFFPTENLFMVLYFCISFRFSSTDVFILCCDLGVTLTIFLISILYVLYKYM